jgi:hypothetical protein
MEDGTMGFFHHNGVRVGALVASLFLAVVFARDASAQQWVGAGADNNWSTGANWSTTTPPPSSATTMVQFGLPTARLSPVVDAPWTVNQISFNGVAYSLSGQAITFAGGTPGVQMNSVVLSPFVIANPIVLTGATAIGLAHGDNLQLTGSISGTGPLTVSGLGAVGLTGASTYAGGTAILGAGIVVLSGSIPGPVSVDIAGGLTGSGGTVNGAVLIGTTGNLNLGTPSGGLNSGDLTIAGFDNVFVTGAGAGQYGSVNVTGAVNLTGGSLTLNGPYAPVPGDVFTIITNDGVDPVIGTFNGLPEGATVSFSGVPLRISYVGGTGNDVTLTALASGLAAIPQVPTLSEWALILLATIALAFGMRASMRKR